MPDLPAIRRPNGRLYRPRNLAAVMLSDEDGIESAVLVLGTHGQEAARPLADDSARRYAGRGYVAVNPVPGWWRDGIERGERVWVWDDVTGRAGLRFEITEKAYPKLFRCPEELCPHWPGEGCVRGIAPCDEAIGRTGNA